MTTTPTIGRVVLYRSRTGEYSVPAIITCTKDTIFEPGVSAGHVPPLSTPSSVHLTVFTPGKPGMRRDATNFQTESGEPRSENASGCYQEWDTPFWGGDNGQADTWNGVLEHQPAGTWTWPPRV